MSYEPGIPVGMGKQEAHLAANDPELELFELQERLLVPAPRKSEIGVKGLIKINTDKKKQ